MKNHLRTIGLGTILIYLLSVQTAKADPHLEEIFADIIITLVAFVTYIIVSLRFIYKINLSILCKGILFCWAAYTLLVFLIFWFTVITDEPHIETNIYNGNGNLSIGDWFLTLYAWILISFAVGTLLYWNYLKRTSINNFLTDDNELDEKNDLENNSYVDEEFK